MKKAHAYERDPEVIEAEITRTRASLDRKLHELERRLSPAHRFAQVREQVRERIDVGPIAAWGAVAAVAVGSVMAVSGLRRARANGAVDSFSEEGDPIVMIPCDETLEA